MRIYENGIYRDLTDEEMREIRIESAKAEAEEKRRPLTESEVSRMLISAQINTLAVDDKMALRMKEFYPNWESGVSYEKDFKVQYNGRLYKVLQVHTSQSNWTPDTTASLYTEINETHSGTIEEPIPYNGNMALEKGKYYSQNNAIYICVRDTINPVYNDLKDLINLYVETI